jgi:hypothetical protein
MAKTFALCAGNRIGPARFPRQVSGVGGRYRGPPGSGPFPGVDPRGAPVECCFRARGGFPRSSSSLFLFPWSNPRRGPGPRPREGPALRIFLRTTATRARLYGKSEPRTGKPPPGPASKDPQPAPAPCIMPARLPIDADQGHGRGKILDATRPGCRQPGQPLDVLTMPATIAHHAAGRPIDADQVTRPREDPRRHAARLPTTWSAPRRAHHAGDDRSPRGPAVDRRGPGPRPREDPRRHAARLPTTWSAPRRAHHAAGRRPIDADQGHGRGEDPRRHAARLPSWSTPRRAHHADRRGPGRRPREDPRRHAGRLPSWSAPRRAHHAAGCRSKRTR